MTADILNFPKGRVVRDVPSEKLQEIQKKAELADAKSIADELFYVTVRNMQQLGLDGNDPSTEYESRLMWEIMKSITFRQFGVEHPHQDIIDTAVESMFGGTTMIKAADFTSEDDFLEAIMEAVEKATKESKDKETGKETVPYDDIPSDTEPKET